MDIIGIGFGMMSFNMSPMPPMQDFFNSSMGNLFQGNIPAIKGSPYIDSDSLVSGIGLGASGIPQPPSYQDFMELTQMQYEQQAEQNQYLYDFRSDVGDMKQQVFENNHYEFDKQGNPVLDEKTGKPKLFEGAEEADQKILRGKWEQGVMKDLDKQHKAEWKEFQQRSAKILKDIQQHPGDALDPEKSKARQQQIMDLAKEEQALRMRHEKENLSATTGHLPNPNNSKETMGDFINNGINEYQTMVNNHEQELKDSPAGQTVQEYFDSINSFVQSQWQTLKEYQSEYDFDPDAMKKYAGRLKFM